MRMRAVVRDAAQPQAQAAAADASGDGKGGSDGRFAFMLAHTWDASCDLTGWLVSEKLDGVRALWTGSALLSRFGVRLLAPPSWTEGLPPGVTLDGELWAGRGRFDEASSTARSAAAGDAAWAKLTFMVFDAPAASGGFEARLAAAAAALIHARSARIVAHAPARDNGAVLARLQEVIAGGGEGLMVRFLTFWRHFAAQSFCTRLPSDTRR
jgi:DNA ligase-1